MKLWESTWQEVDRFDREGVVLVATGSCEQHGPHLPLMTDSALVTAVAEAVEAALPDKVLLLPTLWLGCSEHHLRFCGSLTNSYDSYIGAVESVVDSLVPHGFYKFYVLNGHGGNTSPNDVACRGLKSKHENLQIGHAGYVQFIPDELLATTLEGPLKGIRHSCEAEVSLMMHLRPDLVRVNMLRDDGLELSPAVPGMVWRFDEVTEQGSWGYATHASAEKGRVLFEAAAQGARKALEALADGIALVGRE